MPNIEMIWYIANDEAGQKNVKAEYLHAYMWWWTASYDILLCIPYFLEISPHFQANHPNKRRPRNLAAWQRVPRYIRMHTYNIHGCNADCLSHIFVDLCRRHPRYLAVLELSLHRTGPWNKILLWWDFEEIQYFTKTTVRYIYCTRNTHRRKF